MKDERREERYLVLLIFNIIWTHNVYYYFLVFINRSIHPDSKSLVLTAISQDVNGRCKETQPATVGEGDVYLLM